ncbi:MAG TPA: DUF6435 family protein [Cytophagaceae bacterium]
MKRLLRYFREQRQRKEYTQLRLEAIEAKKRGDRVRYLVLSARADNMLDKVIFS